MLKFILKSLEKKIKEFETSYLSSNVLDTNVPKPYQGKVILFSGMF